jgi:hypothetical protein
VCRGRRDGALAQATALPPVFAFLDASSHDLLVAGLPAGTVTFLFTDIEGSTRLLHQLGDAYAELLREHRRVLRDAFVRHGGVEVDTQGDAFFVAARAEDALGAARDAQAALDGSIRVRMGIHAGEPLLTEEGYVGRPARPRVTPTEGLDDGGLVKALPDGRFLMLETIRELALERLAERPDREGETGREQAVAISLEDAAAAVLQHHRRGDVRDIGP